MKLQADEMISRPTQITTLNLIIFSGSILAISLFELNANSWNFTYGKDLTSQQFAMLSVAVLVYLLSSHIVHWRSDYISFTRWFKTNQTVIGTMGSGSSFNTQEPVLKGIERRLIWLNEKSNQLQTELKK